MGRKIDENKKELAFLLFMNGDLQKDICERVGTTSKTLQNWIEKDGWKERRSGANISRSELIQKGLLAMNNVMEKMLADKDINNYASYMDQLIKCANTIEKLDKKNNIVNDMQAFTNFNNELKRMAGTDPDVSVEVIKLINRLQDKYIVRHLGK